MRRNFCRGTLQGQVRSRQCKLYLYEDTDKRDGRRHRYAFGRHRAWAKAAGELALDGKENRFEAGNNTGQSGQDHGDPQDRVG